MGNIALGRYMDLNSVVNKMDPRTKIMVLLIVMIAIFIPAGFWGYIPIAIFILAALKLSKLSIRFALRSMKPMMFMMVFLLVINVFRCSHSDTVHYFTSAFDDRHDNDSYCYD